MPHAIVAVGEVLWDLFPSGKKLGGAPANFIYHGRGLGADARLVTRVGADALGRELLASLGQLGFPTESIEVDPEAPTGTVDVEVGPGGQPRFTIREGVAWDRIADDEASLALAAAADAVYFGSLSQRSEPSRRAIRSLVSAARPGALRLFDVNLRPPFVDRDVIADSLAMANALKLNDHELDDLAGMFGLPSDHRGAMAELARRFDLSMVALTRGADGGLLLAEGAWSEQPGVPATVVDTVGAGDAFTAALVVGYLAGRPLDAINRHANEVAAYVCSQPGAMPRLPDELRHASADTSGPGT